jgi:hypothetical protein
VTFLLPSEAGYRRAKQARRGATRLDPAFDGFVGRFRGRFGVAPLWLEPDHVKHWGGDRSPKARLDVVLERTDQYRAFFTGGNFNAAKQHATAAMFAEELGGTDLRPIFGLSERISRPDLDADGIFVCFSQFEQVARAEAHQLVTAEQIARFESTLGLGDRFWCTQRFSSPPIVFVHTEEQANALRNDAVREHWADKYFALVRPHDEFGYLERADITVHVDSKQNFDENYESNWYYYYK